MNVRTLSLYEANIGSVVFGKDQNRYTHVRMDMFISSTDQVTFISKVTTRIIVAYVYLKVFFSQTSQSYDTF